MEDPESLYEVAAAVPWDRYMSPEQTLSVDAIMGLVPEGLTHSHFTALTVKVSRCTGEGAEKWSVGAGTGGERLFSVTALG